MVSNTNEFFIFEHLFVIKEAYRTVSNVDLINVFTCNIYFQSSKEPNTVTCLDPVIIIEGKAFVLINKFNCTEIIIFLSIRIRKES